MRAYGVKKYQISGPTWIKTQCYDIEARVPNGARAEEIPAMFQNLLQERFRMRLHAETKLQRVYAIVVGKNGPRLKKTQETDDQTVPISGSTPPARSLSFSPDGHVEIRDVTLGSFADLLTGFLDSPVVDMTGIEGRWDVTLNVSTGDLVGLFPPQAGQTPSSRDGGSGAPASIFSAMQELGLRLESRSTSLSRIIVDQAEKIPTEN
jgi:uncharacterized protein (TIGR03435 family)